MNMIYDSPIGRLKITAQEGAISALSFAEDSDSADSGAERESVLHKAALWLDGYFKGQAEPLPPIAPKGTMFQQRVWRALCDIPFGETRSYGQIAAEVGCASARAIGGAVGKNPVLIMIPCHRVIGADGSLTGFSAGIEHKIDLLNHEKRFT